MSCGWPAHGELPRCARRDASTWCRRSSPGSRRSSTPRQRPVRWVSRPNCCAIVANIGTTRCLWFRAASAGKAMSSTRRHRILRDKKMRRRRRTPGPRKYHRVVGWIPRSSPWYSRGRQINHQKVTHEEHQMPFRHPVAGSWRQQQIQLGHVRPVRLDYDRGGQA